MEEHNPEEDDGGSLLGVILVIPIALIAAACFVWLISRTS